MIYEDCREPDISPMKEVVGTLMFAVSMIGVILFVLTIFIL